MKKNPIFHMEIQNIKHSQTVLKHKIKSAGGGVYILDFKLNFRTIKRSMALA